MMCYKEIMKSKMINYKKICDDLLKDLPLRTREVISRRFGLGDENSKRETLESIGKNYGITRERVRQIENDGFSRIGLETKQCENVFQHFTNEFKKTGNIRREDVLLDFLGGSKFKNQVFFLLTVEKPFKRFSETKETHTLWSLGKDSFVEAQKALSLFYKQLEKGKKPLPLDGFAISCNLCLKQDTVPSCLELSKVIKKGPEGLFGLKDWPEINPRGVKDWAYLVFKKQKKPLHFVQVAELINKTYLIKNKTLPQTIHNELIKGKEFVWVGRGMYALKEWGYESGIVKDVILSVLKKAKKPLHQEDVMREVLNQRIVKKNTVLLNLNNKKYFLKDEQGKYTIRTV